MGGLLTPPAEQEGIPPFQTHHVPMALDDAQGRRVFATEPFLRREAEGWRPQPVKLDDGRTLWVMRPGLSRPPGAPPPGFNAARLLPGLPGTVGLALLAGGYAAYFVAAVIRRDLGRIPVWPR